MGSSNTEEIVIKLQEPHEAQKQILDAINKTQYRFITVACGRRFGKTELLVNDATYFALSKQTKIAYVSLSYRNVQEFFNRIIATLAPVIDKKNETDKTIYLKNGSIIECWSVDGIANARGRSYERIYFDEAGIVPNLQNIFLEVLRPMMLDYGQLAKAIFTSTPKGKTFFFDLYNFGQDPEQSEYCSFRFPSTANPLISVDELESIRVGTPSVIFNQEYLALFEDDSGIFKGIDAVSILKPQEPAQNKIYVAGLDFGQAQDFTVLSILDVTDEKPKQVAVFRWNQVSYELIRERIIDTSNRYSISAILAETNSIGSVNLEMLQTAGLPIIGFATTAQSKRPVIEQLAVAIEQQKIELLDDTVQKNELNSFVSKKTATGHIKYEASGTNHDDTVIALALAFNQAKRSTTSLIAFDY